ncbi:MAG: Slp/YeaY family lipoprotein [Desulfobacterales bacterium]
MRIYWNTCLVLFVTLLTLSCSVISKQTRKERSVSLPFEILLKEPAKYKGNTVILGGYILEIRNLSDKTMIIVLQSPLQFGDEPGSRDDSKGRFIVTHKGFLDPEIYRKDRKITVAGIIVGLTSEPVDQGTYTYITLQSREIYLWTVYDNNRYWPYHYDPFYPYHYYRHPYYHRHPYYW